MQFDFQQDHCQLFSETKLLRLIKTFDSHLYEHGCMQPNCKAKSFSLAMQHVSSHYHTSTTLSASGHPFCVRPLLRLFDRLLARNCITSCNVALLFSLKFHNSEIGYPPLGLYSFISFKATTTASYAASPMLSFSSFNFSSSSLITCYNNKGVKTDIQMQVKK